MILYRFSDPQEATFTAKGIGDSYISEGGKKTDMLGTVTKDTQLIKTKDGKYLVLIFSQGSVVSVIHFSITETSGDNMAALLGVAQRDRLIEGGYK